jgi:hypothetical protein
LRWSLIVFMGWPKRTQSEVRKMENWPGLFLFVIFAMLVNLIVAFFVLRGLANLVGVPPGTNTPRRALISLLTILPVAGAAGAPFFIIPFIGPILGTFISACVAPFMFGEKYELETAVAAKIILPTVLVVYAVTGVMVYQYGIPTF